MNRTALLISDDSLNGRVASMLLKEAGLEVVTAPRSKSLAELRERGFDLFVIFVREWDKSWSDLCQTLRKEVLNPILVVSPHGNEATALAAYNAGVDEYIAAFPGPALFLAKVQAWLRQAWALPIQSLAQVQVGPNHLDPGRREFSGARGDTIHLTNLEFRVLYLLMVHAGRSLTPDFIIERVWGSDQAGDAASLKNVIYRLRRKIEDDPEKPSLLLTMQGQGYAFAAHE